MQESKSTDKLMIVEGIVDKLPVSKIKSVSIIWKTIECGGLDIMPVPDLMVEMYETADEKEEIDE